MNCDSNRARIFVVGLDGATFDLVRPWAEKGLLPTLRKLMEEGCWGELTSTIPPFTAPAWCSFATGKNPGKHGLYDFAGRKPGTYQMVPLNASSIRSPTLWQILSRHGRKVAVLNVPLTYPPAPVNGVLVTGMLTPPNAATFTYPPDFASELMSAVPGYTVWPDGVFHPMGREPDFLRVVHELTEMRLKAARFLMQKLDWDFFMVVFRGPDLVQHWLWRHMEKGEDSELGQGILSVYRRVDGAIASLIGSLPSKTTVIIMSDHGAGPLDTYVHVNTWLLREGYLKIKASALSKLKLAMFRVGLTPRAFYRLLMRTGLRKGIGAMVRERKSAVRGMLDRVFLSFRDVDWPKSLAYSYGNVGPIYLNVKGREPQGCVEPGRHYEEIREEISLRLQELRDPRTGKKLVERVYRKEELYSGEALEDAPDLFFIPKDLRCQAFGLLQFTSNQWLEPSFDRSGGHRMNGVFLAWGEGVRQVTLEGIHMTDLTPTILALLDVPIPEDMDGRVIREAFQEAFWQGKEIRYCGVEESVARTDTGLSQEEEEQIHRRLKGLGYV